MDVVSDPQTFFSYNHQLAYFHLNHTLPSNFWITQGYGLSSTSQLNAFDAALLVAGIGHINLLTYSSIIPLHAVYKADSISIPPGSQTGIIQALEYGTLGEQIATGLAVAHADEYFVVYEAHGKTSEHELRKLLVEQITEALEARSAVAEQILIVSQEAIVDRKFGCSTTNIVFEPKTYV